MRLDPIPRQAAPASSQLRMEASVGSTPPVGMMRVQGMGTQDGLHESGAAHFLSRKDLYDLHPEFLGGRDFGSRSTAGRIGDLSPVAQPGHFGV